MSRGHRDHQSGRFSGDNVVQKLHQGVAEHAMEPAGQVIRLVSQDEGQQMAFCELAPRQFLLRGLFFVQFTRFARFGRDFGPFFVRNLVSARFSAGRLLRGLQKSHRTVVLGVGINRIRGILVVLTLRHCCHP